MQNFARQGMHRRGNIASPSQMYNLAMLEFFQRPLMRVFSMRPCACISYVAPPRLKLYGLKLSPDRSSSAKMRLKRARKEEPLRSQQGVRAKPNWQRSSSIACTVSSVIGSRIVTLSRVLFPALTAGQRHHPIEVINDKVTRPYLQDLTCA